MANLKSEVRSNDATSDPAYPTRGAGWATWIGGKTELELPNL